MLNHRDTEGTEPDPDPDSDSDMYCLNCRYSLRHLESQQCPECGQAFDATNPKTYLSKLESIWRWELIVAAICFVFAWVTYPFRVNWINFPSYFYPFFVWIALSLGFSLSAARRGGLVNRSIALIILIFSVLYLMHILIEFLGHFL